MIIFYHLMDISIWNFKDYKKFLKGYIRATRQRGTIVKLAQAAGCQPSYLSQVLTKEINLTPDHILGISEYIHLNEEETDYLCLLLDHARAGTPKLKSRIHLQLEKIRIRNEEVGQRLNRSVADKDEILQYWVSHWTTGALHILSSIPEYQTVTAAAQRLKLPESQVLTCFEKLLELGCVTRLNGRYIHSGVGIHIPANSNFILNHHFNWRQKALLSAQEKSSQHLHFSGVYSVARSDLSRLRELFLSTLKQADEIATQAPTEELICFACDVFTP